MCQAARTTQWDDSYRVAVVVYIAHAWAVMAAPAAARQAQEFRHIPIVDAELRVVGMLRDR